MAAKNVKRALILGVGGQDGSYLAEVLLQLGYEVHGLYRRSSVDNLWRVRHLILQDKVKLHQGDLTDASSLMGVIAECWPLDEVYNEADQDHVGWSYTLPWYASDVTGAAVGRLLEILRGDTRQEKVKFFQPLSATMFGNPDEIPQKENTKLRPNSPYACAKAYAWHLCRHYRRECGMFVSTAIMYNHDSPRRGPDYLLQRICREAVEIAEGKRESIKLARPDAFLDVGFAGDYMAAAWQILQLDKPDDFLLSGWRLPVRDWVALACKEAGISDPTTAASFAIEVDTKYNRPGGFPQLTGDCSKAKEAFGYTLPTSAERLVSMIVNHYRYGEFE